MNYLIIPAILSFLFIGCEPRSVESTTENTETPRYHLRGKYILKESSCAGLNFIDSNRVSWTNEAWCEADTMNLRWLTNDIFMMRDIRQINKDCPPRVHLYKIVSYDGKKLVLNDIWTGWNNHPDDIEEFTKE